MPVVCLAQVRNAPVRSAICERVQILIIYNRAPFACVRASAEDPTDAVIEPNTGVFDLSEPLDVETDITFNDAWIVSSVMNVVTPLVLNTDYTFDGTTLTILSDYLSTRSPGAVPITINFNVGNPSTLTITVTT